MKVVVIGGTGPAPSTFESETELAARFAREAEPLFDVLARGARRLARSEADTEDLVQDTLLHAFAGFHTYKDGTNLKAWLFRILYNRWVSTHRYRQRRPMEVAVDEVGERDLADGAARLSSGPRSAESEFLDALPDSEIKAALAALPDGVGGVIYYVCIQGYTYAEAAAMMNIPVGTVMSRVSRGRQRLRIALGHLDHGAASVEQRVA